MTFNMEKEYPKTMFAMRALESAVAEETEKADEKETRNIAMTALAGVTMMLGNVVIGKGAGLEGFDGETAKEAMRMLALCLKGTAGVIFTEDSNELN